LKRFRARYATSVGVIRFHDDTADLENQNGFIYKQFGRRKDNKTLPISLRIKKFIQIYCTPNELSDFFLLSGGFTADQTGYC
jgi:hypothetical protein